MRTSARFWTATPVDQRRSSRCRHEDQRAARAACSSAIGDEPVTIHVVPDLFRFASLRGGVEEFEGIPFIHLRDSPLHGWNRVAKRVFDLAFCAAALVGLAPVLACIAARGEADVRGAGALPPGAHGAGRPALPDAQVPHHAARRRGARRDRCGRGRRPAAHALRHRAAALQPRRAAAVHQRAARRDEHWSGRGRSGRSSSRTFRQTVPGYMLRHKVKSGITGWAQVNGCAATPRSRSASSTTSSTSSAGRFGFDLKIIALTVGRGPLRVATPIEVTALRERPARRVRLGLALLHLAGRGRPRRAGRRCGSGLLDAERRARGYAGRCSGPLARLRRGHAALSALASGPVGGGVWSRRRSLLVLALYVVVDVLQRRRRGRPLRCPGSSAWWPRSPRSWASFRSPRARRRARVAARGRVLPPLRAGAGLLQHLHDAGRRPHPGAPRHARRGSCRGSPRAGARSRLARHAGGPRGSPMTRGAWVGFAAGVLALPAVRSARAVDPGGRPRRRRPLAALAGPASVR